MFLRRSTTNCLPADTTVEVTDNGEITDNGEMVDNLLNSIGDPTMDFSDLDEAQDRTEDKFQE